MFMRRAKRHHGWPAPTARSSTAPGPSVKLTVGDEGVAVMTLQRPPVNSLNLDLLRDISKTLDHVDENKCKAAILTSTYPRVFSAGIDLEELYRPDLKRFAEFWSTLQEVWIKLYGSRCITSAAINGHAPAGGCVLAMCCEYRVMVQGNFTIGMNETSAGFFAPTWAMDMVKNTIPARKAEYAFTAAKMFTVKEALKVGLIDEVAADKVDAIVKCERFIRKFDDIPQPARSLTKLRIRQAAIKKLQDNRQAEIDEVVHWIQHPDIQKNIGMYLQKIRNTNLA